MTLANQAGKLKKRLLYNMNLIDKRSSPSTFFYWTLYC